MDFGVLILAVVAVFLFLKLRDVLGKKTGHENPDAWFGNASRKAGAAEKDSVVPFPGAEMPVTPPVVSNEDVEAVIDLESNAGQALVKAKDAEPGFDARHFLEGSRSAYEMILMGYETGDKTTLRPLLAPNVFESFSAAIDDRKSKGYSVDARFVGLRDAKVEDAHYDEAARTLDVTVAYDAEMIVVVRDAKGEIVEGDAQAVKRMRDVWTYRRVMGSPDPAWLLTETDG